jgi:hypothetical protein
MSRLSDLITSLSTGTAMNYHIFDTDRDIEFEQKFTVVKDNTNFKWTITVELFCKKITTLDIRLFIQRHMDWGR